MGCGDCRGGTAGLSAARALAERGRRVAVLEGGPLVLLTHTSTTDLRFDQAGLARLQAMVEYSPRQPDGSIFGHLFACLGGRASGGTAPHRGSRPRTLPPGQSDWPISSRSMTGPRSTSASTATTPRLDSARWSVDNCAEPAPRRARPLRHRHQAHAKWVDRGNRGQPSRFASTHKSTNNTAGRAASGRIELRYPGVVGRQRTTARGVVVTDAANHNEYEVLARSVVLAASGVRIGPARDDLQTGRPQRANGYRHRRPPIFRAYYAVPATIYDPTTPEAAIIAVRADDQRAFQLEIHMPSDALFGLSEHTVWQPAANLQYAAMVRSFAPVKPVPANHIELGTTGAPGDYTVHLTYGADDLALLDAMTAGLNQVGTALGANESLKIQQFAPGDSHHEAGGLIMGTDPTSSVTDAFGRFHSVPNVIVADAATWPITSAANPCLTMALAHAKPNSYTTISIRLHRNSTDTQPPPTLHCSTCPPHMAIRKDSSSVHRKSGCPTRRDRGHTGRRKRDRRGIAQTADACANHILERRLRDSPGCDDQPLLAGLRPCRQLYTGRLPLAVVRAAATQYGCGR